MNSCLLVVEKVQRLVPFDFLALFLFQAHCFFGSVTSLPNDLWARVSPFSYVWILLRCRNLPLRYFFFFLFSFFFSGHLLFICLCFLVCMLFFCPFSVCWDATIVLTIFPALPFNLHSILSVFLINHLVRFVSICYYWSLSFFTRLSFI